jgi:sterol desaturase/sphingolipid hydroxylase (fatty acid hydroxylase superfamily)
MTVFSEYWQSNSLDMPLETLSEKAMRGIIDGSWLMVYITIPTLLLELWSLETATALYKKNPRLYCTAIGLNLFNHFVLGMPSYVLGVCFYAQDLHLPTTSTALVVLLQVMITVVIHSLCFFYVHKVFHTVPQLYKWHKFHHLFNTLVTPVTANAVSPVEYFVAYLTPFMISMTLLRSTETSLWLAIQVISIFNLAMHTPKLQHFYHSAPQWIVSTEHHLEHHKRLSCHYAAPTFNLDYIAALLSTPATATATTSGDKIAPAAAGSTNNTRPDGKCTTRSRSTEARREN